MPTTKHENHHPSIDRDVEIRARKLRLRMIVALCNFSVLIILLGIFWLYIRAIPSSMPFPMRWICIVCLYLETIAKNAWLIQIIDAIGRKHMSKLEDENRSRNRDLMTRTADLEDWILATCCVIAGLSTTGFVAWYWTEVIKLTAQSVFYWTCTMAGLCLLFWLFECAIKFYRKTKGLQHEDAWGLLICVNVLEFYNKFEAYGVLGRFADAVCLLLELPKALFYIMGFYIGRGSLFDRLPDEWKTERRRCKTWDDVANFFAIFAGEACFPPSDYEWQPNPVIFPHSRIQPLQSPNSGPSVAKDISNYHLVNTAGAAEGFCPDTTVDFDKESVSNNNQESPSAPRHTGPATFLANLSAFACEKCTYVAKKKGQLKKHIIRKHDRPFKCVYHGCGKTFGSRTNLVRHEATHTGGKGFQCSNPWCKTPGEVFTREDNLKRHMNRCITCE